MAMPKLESIRELLLDPGEIFVSAGGFEDRVLVFPNMLQPCADRNEKVLILEYLPTNKNNKLKELQSVLFNKSYNPINIPYARYSPEAFDVAFRQELEKFKVEAVCLDISGLSRFAIMIILDVVREMNLPLRLIYVEASNYAPSRNDFNAAKATASQNLPTSFIHTGVYDVLYVPRLASIRMQNRATLLIAFDSFNEALGQALVNVINPSRFILINGQPPRKELKWREDATAYVHKFLRSEWSFEDDNYPIKTTSTLYYQETYKLLSDIYWRFSANHRIILAPTGSKMQTIGAYFLRAVHDDVHVVYPTVQGFFSDKYSTGVRERWQLNFGRMGDFVEYLRQKEISERLGLPQEPVNTDID